MLNNQPMGFYHPATLVKDAQRHGVSFVPIDVQSSDWECRVEPDGRVRLGLMYVNGLRQETGRAIAGAGVRGPRSGLGSAGPLGAISQNEVEFAAAVADRCPKCGNDDQSMLEDTQEGGRFCNICAHEWSEQRSDVATTLASHPGPEPRTASPDPRDRGPRTADGQAALHLHRRSRSRAPASDATSWRRWRRSAR